MFKEIGVSVTVGVQKTRHKDVAVGSGGLTGNTGNEFSGAAADELNIHIGVELPEAFAPGTQLFLRGGGVDYQVALHFGSVCGVGTGSAGGGIAIAAGHKRCCHQKAKESREQSFHFLISFS